MTDNRFPILPCGDDALRIACGPGRVRHHIARHLGDTGNWQEIVPGKEDVTVVFDPHAGTMNDAKRRLAEDFIGLSEADIEASTLHFLPAVFGGGAGPDLEALASNNGVSESAIIEAIAGIELEVDMIGFTPGFSYLTGVPPSLVSHRLATPRMRVPPGSIGIITGQAGLYALEGPGGWPLIGRVTEALFDPHADKPFRLLPGDRVRFVPERGS